MKLHKYCALFPEMDADSLVEIVSSMKATGFQKDKPIIMLGDEILDGQNRFKAAQAAGLKPTFKTFAGTDPLAFVIRENMSRRHLTQSQRAMIAAEIAKTRGSGATIAEAAKQMGVSLDSVNIAVKLKKKSSRIAKSVMSGKMTLHKAEKKSSPQPKSVPRGGLFANKVASESDISSKSEPAKKEKTLGQIGYEAYASKIGIDIDWNDSQRSGKNAWEYAALEIKSAARM